ncbi:MAG: DUF4974 domain-containing protein [Muribaculaceae bacterium]|nr:DUF4974 domain-containing protein [Muribaculaceae bacterium]
MKDKLDRFLDLINDNDSVTDQYVRQILEDKDYKNLYNITTKTTDALTETPEVDIDREWHRFEKRNFGKNTVNNVSRLSRFFSRNAAAVTIFIAASLAVVAATIGVTYSIKNQSKEYLSEKEVSEMPAKDNVIKTSVPESAKTVTSEETIIFKNQSLNNILSAIADYYGVSLIFKTDKSKNLRLYFQWNQSLPPEEIISQLNNFEQVDIKFDNNVIISK